MFYDFYIFIFPIDAELIVFNFPYFQYNVHEHVILLAVQPNVFCQHLLTLCLETVIWIFLNMTFHS